MLKYLKSREFLITIGAIFGVGILVYVLFFFVFLPLYTNHGEETEVPEVAQMQLEDAIAALEEAGLDYEVADSLYLVNLDPLAVISQDPLGKSKVKPGRKVYLTVNKVVAPMVKFPDITGMSLYNAKLKIEGAGLQFGKPTYVPHEYSNLVLGATCKGQKVAEGMELRKGSKIDFVVGEGKGNQKVATPNLVDMTYESAISTLQRLGLNIGLIRFDEASSKAAGTIIDQYPKFSPEDSLSLGTEMSLWVAGKEFEETQENVGDTIVGSSKGDNE